jgi:hypothetical protein
MRWWQSPIPGERYRALQTSRYPGSRRVPWTNAPELGRILPIDFLHLAERVLGARGVPRIRRSHGERGFERLCRLATERRVAVMCAEAVWWRCHRRLIADALVIRGYEVVHIDREGRTQSHRLTEQAVV